MKTSNKFVKLEELMREVKLFLNSVEKIENLYFYNEKLNFFDVKISLLIAINRMKFIPEKLRLGGNWDQYLLIGIPV